jgi:hypothetical protein
VASSMDGGIDAREFSGLRHRRVAIEGDSQGAIASGFHFDGRPSWLLGLRRDMDRPLSRVSSNSTAEGIVRASRNPWKRRRLAIGPGVVRVAAGPRYLAATGRKITGSDGAGKLLPL